MIKACAVIPAFNEADFISAVVERSAAYCRHVIVVDDGSTDGTGERARQAGAEVLTHSTNQGKGAALATGFSHARSLDAEWVVTLDADLQHAPEEIPRLMECAQSRRLDLVLGSRMGNTQAMPLLRLVTNRTTSFFVSWFSRTRVHDSQSGFRLVSGRVLDRVELRTRRFETESELILEAGRAGFRIGETTISTIYGDEKSKIDKVGDTLRFIRLMLCYL